jgi:hypothetical protein
MLIRGNPALTVGGFALTLFSGGFTEVMLVKIVSLLVGKEKNSPERRVIIEPDEAHPL